MQKRIRFRFCLLIGCRLLPYIDEQGSWSEWSLIGCDSSWVEQTRVNAWRTGTGPTCFPFSTFNYRLFAGEKKTRQSLAYVLYHTVLYMRHLNYYNIWDDNWPLVICDHFRHYVFSLVPTILAYMRMYTVLVRVHQSCQSTSWRSTIGMNKIAMMVMIITYFVPWPVKWTYSAVFDPGISSFDAE